MVGRRLDLLDPVGLGLIEVGNQRFETLTLRAFERGEFLDPRGPPERKQPLGLDPDPLPNQAVFAENSAQLADAAAVPAVDRRDGCKGAEFHA